jgi:hypothetical protein
MGSFLVNEKAVVCVQKLLVYIIYLGFWTAFVHMVPLPHEHNISSPYNQVSHPHTTVLTITVPNAELLELVAVGETKSSEMTGSTPPSI